MSITIGETKFDGIEYDARGDVLYLSIGAPCAPARTLETTEGHAVDYDEDGRLIGMVLLNVRWTLERDGELRVTLPEHPAVAECAVVAAPDEERGHVVMAYVVAGRAVTAKELQDHVKSVTAPYKYPRIVEFAEELPKTPSGKIRRAELR